jgi:hypothetical protein
MKNKIYRTPSFYVYEFSENIGVIFVFVCLLFAKFSAPNYTRVRGLTIPSRADRNNRTATKPTIIISNAAQAAISEERIPLTFQIMQLNVSNISRALFLSPIHIDIISLL